MGTCHRKVPTGKSVEPFSHQLVGNSKPWSSHALIRAQWVYKGRAPSAFSARLVWDTMEDTPNLSVQNFPLFAPMTAFDFPNDEPTHLAEDPDRMDWYMCLWKEGAEDSLPCSFPCGDFSNFLFHLKDAHGKVLRTKIDYCHECQVIFKNRNEASQS